MKIKNLILFIFIWLITLDISAQTTFNPQNFKDSLKREIGPTHSFNLPVKSAKAPLFVLDSVIHSQYYPDSDSVIVRDYYKYDNKGNRREWKNYSTCIGCASAGNFKQEYQYNENDSCSTIIYSKLDLDTQQWLIAWKQENEYDINGKLLSVTDLKYTNLIPEWVNTGKEEYTYDSNGELLNKILYNWNDNQKKWIFSKKYEWVFDVEGKLNLSYSYSQYNEEEELWTSIRKVEYLYDILRNDSIYYYYNWNKEEGDWNLDSKAEFIIDPTEKSSGYSVYQVDNDGNWIGNNREISFYNENGILILHEISDWDNTKSEWVYNYKTENEFDFDNQLIAELTSRWDKTKSDWIYRTKRRFDYDSNNYLKTENNYSWNTYDLWWLHENHEYFYSELTTNNNADVPEPQGVKIYPNPTNETFTIETQNHETAFG